MNFSAKAGCYGLYIAILVHWRVHVWEFPASANGHSSSDILGPGVDCSMEYSVLQPQRIENHCVTIILSCKNSKRLSWLVASIHALKSDFFLYIQCSVLSSHQCGVCLPWAQRDQRASYWCNMKLNQSNWYGTSISLRSLVGAFASSSNLSKLKPLSYSAIWSTNVAMWCCGPHHVCIATSDANTSKSISLSNFCPGELASSGTFCTSKELHPSNACWIKCGKPPEIGFGKSFPPSSHEEQATCTCVQGSTAWVDSITQVLWKMPVDMLVDAGGI